MVNRIYFDINEEQARQAHNMMSFQEYNPGKLTSEYERYVNEAYDLADEVAKERPESADKVYRLAERYSKRMAENMNARSRIGCMCPSVMISGAGNFPVKKKEKQNAAMDKNYKEFNEIQEILKKIRSIKTGKESILSGDENVVEKLQIKLEKMKSNQERMKEANKAIRLKDKKKGDAILGEMGYTKEQIEQLREPDFCGRVGYPSYMLTNNNSNIKRVEERIKELISVKAEGNSEYENGFFRIIENTEIMRLQLFFEGKPDSDTRTVLKKYGFRWSPKNECWQRQLTNNAKYALEQIVKELEE